MQEGVLASAPYAILFWISRGTCPLCPTAPHASVYLKANKDYNNEFSEDGKILKVGRSPEVSWRLPHLPPPPDIFFSRGRNILFHISGGAYLEVGHMPYLFWNWGCICTICRTAPHASVKRDQTERHDFWPRLWLFFSTFLFLPKKTEKKKRRMNSKNCDFNSCLSARSCKEVKNYNFCYCKVWSAITIEQKGKTQNHDFCYSFSFSTSLFLNGREKGKRMTKVVILSHAFLLDPR